MRIIGVIPARFKSSRFPGKPLINLLGKPMIIHVAEIVEKALGRECTYIATDDEKIKDTVESFGFRCVMTSPDCLTGTDRVWDVAQQISADIYINVQGDEPMLNPGDILKIADVKKNFPEFVVNGMYPLSQSEDPQNINIPKVLVNQANDLIYMSRLPIPGIKDAKTGTPAYFKQICIYAFNYNELKSFGERKEKASFEKFEDIEILRFLDLGVGIKMVETSVASLAIDIPEDVQLVENALRIKQARSN